MVGGFDKYFQIAPCFRDEDPRSDRSPTDFYQLDIEMSFVEEHDIFQLVEKVFVKLFDNFSNTYSVNNTFPVISFEKSMEWYGTDKPDLRNPIKMIDVSEFFVSSGFKIFADILTKDGTKIKAIPAKGGGSRKFCDRMNKFAQEQGLPGMGYIFWRSDDSGELEAAGPIAKNLGEEKTEKLRDFLGLDKGDAAFFLGGVPAHFNEIASKSRNIVGLELGITNSNSYEFCWIADFPMYERDKETGKIEFSHNPFSMPKVDLSNEDIDPLSVLGMQYDLSCNGYEILSGAIRNHKLENLFKAFEIAGYTKEEVESQFSGLVNALKYGAPPHGGCAAGIDRIVMLLAKEDNIREVIMFPMNQRAEDPMLGSPRTPTTDQLDELKLKIIDHDL
jgi:aspartyl-tRNA synthetase